MWIFASIFVYYIHNRFVAKTFFCDTSLIFFNHFSSPESEWNVGHFILSFSEETVLLKKREMLFHIPWHLKYWNESKIHSSNMGKTLLRTSFIDKNKSVRDNWHHVGGYIHWKHDSNSCISVYINFGNSRCVRLWVNFSEPMHHYFCVFVDVTWPIVLFPIPPTSECSLYKTWFCDLTMLFFPSQKHVIYQSHQKWFGNHGKIRIFVHQRFIDWAVIWKGVELSARRDLAMSHL